MAKIEGRRRRQQKMRLLDSISDSTNMNLSELWQRWQEYTEELYKIDLHDPDNHDGVITHPDPSPGM